MKNIVYYIAIATVLLFASCASELDTEPSGSQVSDEQLSELIKENADLVLAPMMQGAVNYMHTGNRQATTNDRGFMVWNLGMDLQGNDMVLTKLTNWFADEYMFESIRAQTNAYTADRWYCYYKIVYQSNQILDPSTEVYSTITTDLQNAIALFEQEGYDPKSSTADIDQTVANMVLARVALTTGDYTTAANAAGAVISAGYSLMNEEQYTTSGFQSTSLPETIWGYTWAASTSLGNRSFASFMSITAVDNANNKGIYMAIDDQLYNQIAATDYRKKNFNATETTVGEFTYPAYSNVKFNTPTYEADEIYMRLSEAYLLKAEAEARGGNSSAAQQTLYDLVSKRDSGYAKSSNTGEALLKEIFLQSRIELWGEGHEFFTNKRFNVGVDRTASSNHTHKLVKAAGKEFTYQIPLSIELNSNPYINAADQNPL